MPSRKATVTTGLIEQVDTFIDANAADLTAAGVDLAALKARLATAKSGILNTDTAKEEAHDIAEAATRTADDAEQRGYDTVSSVVDAAAGGLGKKSSDGKRILELRATANKERKRTRPAPAPTPTP